MQSSRILYFSGIAIAAGALGACSGGGSSTYTAPSANPILVAGKVAKYSGTDAIAHVFTNPLPGQANYNEAYTLSQTTTVNAATSGAAAPFDVNTAITFTSTLTQAAGTQKESTITDNFENQAASGVSEDVSIASQTVVTTGIDVTGGLTGGGPYTLGTNTTTKYTTPQTVGVYPLQAGATYAEPLARTIAETETDANAAGTAPVTAFPTSLNQTDANDGSYTRTAAINNGETTTFTESSNGSAQLAETGPLFTLQETIGVPTGTPYTIPVTSLRQLATTGATPAPVATAVAYSAADWYPGNALPPQPLASETISVKGATTTLPAACSGALTEPNVFEVDEKSTTLNVDGSYTTLAQQRFDSNGTNVCVLRTQTTSTYSVTTGLPVETSTETYAQLLTALTLPSASSVGHAAAAKI